MGILNVLSGDPLFAFLDQRIRETKSNVTDTINKALARPMELIKMFQSFCWLLEEETEEYLEGWTSQKNPETGNYEPYPLEDYMAELARVDKALKAVQNTSYFIEDFG